MSVEQYIQSILNNEGKAAIELWDAAIQEYPQSAITISEAVSDHLVDCSSWI